MTKDVTPDLLRRATRAAALLLAGAVSAVAAPASAAPPETWEDTSSDSVLGDLLYLVGVPLLVVALITLLVYLPSMIRRQSGERAGTFGEDPEWFGGPRAGLEATASTGGATARDDEAKGGAGARW